MPRPWLPDPGGHQGRRWEEGPSPFPERTLPRRQAQKGDIEPALWTVNATRLAAWATGLLRVDPKGLDLPCPPDMALQFSACGGRYKTWKRNRARGPTPLPPTRTPDSPSGVRPRPRATGACCSAFRLRWAPTSLEDVSSWIRVSRWSPGQVLLSSQCVHPKTRGAPYRTRKTNTLY